MNAWPVEAIPDADRLFYRVHKMWLRDGAAVPGAFKDRQGSMSTDWAKYSTAIESRDRAKLPQDNAVGVFIVGELRQLAGQQVVHSPDTQRGNRAHSDVIGEKDEEARVRLSRMLQWVLPLGPATPSVS